MKQNFIKLISVFFMLQIAINLQAAQAARVARIVEVIKALPKRAVHHQLPVTPAPVPKVAAKALPQDIDADLNFALQLQAQIDADIDLVNAFPNQPQPAPAPLPKAVAQDIAEDVTCIVCQESVADLEAGNQMMATNCCHAPICQNDFNQAERVARETYNNYHNDAWRRNYANSPDFGTDPAFPGGWPSEEMQNRKEAACPNCKFYPLQVHNFDVQGAQCSLCDEDRAAHEFRRLKCGHQYCNVCLAHMLDDAIRDKSTERLRCPECLTRPVFTEVDIRNIRNLQSDVDKIATIQTQEWLQAQSNKKQCPTPNCGNVFLVDSAEPAHQMQCPSCEQRYCTQCLMQHDPKITCARAKAMRVTDDQASAKLIQEISKACPSCKVPIQKIEGCARMKCKCKHDFCWNCLREWGAFGYAYHNTFGSECRVLEIIRETIATVQDNLRRTEDNLRLNPTGDEAAFQRDTIAYYQTSLKQLQDHYQQYLKMDEAKRAQALAKTAINEEDLWNLQPKQGAVNADEYFAKQAQQPKQAPVVAKANEADRAEQARIDRLLNDGYAQDVLLTHRVYINPPQFRIDEYTQRAQNDIAVILRRERQVATANLQQIANDLMQALARETNENQRIHLRAFLNAYVQALRAFNVP